MAVRPRILYSFPKSTATVEGFPLSFAPASSEKPEHAHEQFPSPALLLLLQK
jgi:hypothetical protein